MSKAVIFIPGIKGSKLFDSNDIDNKVLWQDVRFNFKDVSKLALSFEHNGNYYDDDFQTIVEPLKLENVAYKQFWEKLEPNYDNKFLFPYDWRLPNEINGDKLKEFMDHLMEKSKALDIEEITEFDMDMNKDLEEMDNEVHDVGGRNTEHDVEND